VRPVVLLAGALLILAGCSSGSSSPRPSPTRVHIQPDLLRRAHLAPCPASTATPVSDGLPDVTLPCLGHGPAVRLDAVQGQPLVVNIWGSWCGPCQKESRYLAQVYDALKPRVLFLGVDDEDDPDSALDFAAHVTPPMRYPSVLDDDKKVLIGLHLVSAVPSTVFVTATGRIAHVSAGPYLDEASLLADIHRYLGVAT
jgi:cytochrome c biogenesis protein CcmG/thiol:disulfide interchange protein DsbE